MADRTADTRTRIMDAAKRLFYNQGYHCTGINQIIDEAEIAKASLYQHFKSKEDLLVAYLEESHREKILAIHQFLTNYKTARAKITGLFDYRISIAKAHQFRGCGFMRISAEVDMIHEKEIVKATIKEHKNKILKLIESIIDDCDFGHKVNRKQLSERIFLIYEGAQINSTLLQSIAPLEEAKKLAKEMLR